MRALVINFMLLGCVLIALFQPWAGVLGYNWFTYMNPHRLAWGLGIPIPWAKVIAGLTLAGWLLGGMKGFRLSWVTGLLLALFAWTTITSLDALFPERAWEDWTEFAKMAVTALVATALLDDRRRLHAFVWIVVISLAYWTVKGGLYVVLTGGSGRVVGPPQSQFPETNRFARVAIMVLPLIWWLRLHSARLWVRRAMMAAAGLTLLSLIGTGSRGGFVGFVAMLGFAWLHSRRKLGMAMLGGAALAVLLLAVPVERLTGYSERIGTIGDYAEEASAKSRFKTWAFALDMAAREPVTGGGFGAFLANRQETSRVGYYEAHSIYFQMLGEHGWAGLGLWLALALALLLTGRRAMRRAEAHPHLYWARDLAMMLQIALVGFLAGGVFENLAFFELYYTLAAMLVLTDRIVAREAVAPAAAPPIRIPALEAR